MADFGLAEDMYGTNYYRRSKSESEERVPIRWMAPESIETNIYNEATDIVSLHALGRRQLKESILFHLPFTIQG